MGAKTAMSVEQYLTTSFPDLDKEYRDGELEERSLPDYLHGRTQGMLFAFFLMLSKKFPLFPTVETRLRLANGIFLIPDVSVFYPNEPRMSVPDVPPLIAIEVLSSDDRMTKVREKLNEYQAWGVAHVWLVDPHAKRMYSCDSGFAEVDVLRVQELDIEMKPADIF
jgi:Uma2 family endonuclease